MNESGVGYKDKREKRARSPKYMKIVNWVKEKTSSGEYMPGFRIASENELSEMFHISRQTVRRALSQLEDEGITESRRGSGTYISNFYGEKETSNNGTMNIAVLTTYVDEYIFPSMIGAIEKCLSSKGYTIQLSFSHNRVAKERQILEHILEYNNVDGLLFETTRSALPNPNLDLYEEIRNRGIPIIFMNSYYSDIDIPHVSMDDKYAGKAMTSYLISKGHRKIAAIFKCDDGQGLRRYEGYEEALKEADIEFEDDAVLWVDTRDINPLKAHSKRVLDRIKGCTAVVCYNDTVAEQFIRICTKADIKIPEDLSVVGIDNADISKLTTPPLTTITNPVMESGRIIAENLIRLINGEKFEATVELVPEIVERQSVNKLT